MKKVIWMKIIMIYQSYYNLTIIMQDSIQPLQDLFLILNHLKDLIYSI